VQQRNCRIVCAPVNKSLHRRALTCMLTRALCPVSSLTALQISKCGAWHAITARRYQAAAAAAATGAGAAGQPVSTAQPAPTGTAAGSKRPRRMPGRYTCPACGNTSNQVDNLLHHMRKCCGDLLPPAWHLSPQQLASQTPDTGPSLESAAIESMLAAAQEAEAQLRSQVLTAARQLVSAAAASGDAAGTGPPNPANAAAGSSSRQNAAGHTSQRSTRHRAPALVDVLSPQQCQQLAADMQLPVSR
jgi:hypothetical protein